MNLFPKNGNKQLDAFRVICPSCCCAAPRRISLFLRGRANQFLGAELKHGVRPSTHLFATFPRLAWGELLGPLLLTEDILAEPLDYADFSLGVPDKPGLGITLDEDKIASFRRDRK